MISIAKTGFVVSVASYAFFLFADYLRPGFVSSVFSVHVFLVPTIIFGVLFARFHLDPDRDRDGTFIAAIVTGLLLGAIVGYIFWREGEVFGDFRLVLAIVAFLVPWTIPAGGRPHGAAPTAFSKF